MMLVIRALSLSTPDSSSRRTTSRRCWMHARSNGELPAWAHHLKPRQICYKIQNTTVVYPSNYKKPQDILYAVITPAEGNVNYHYWHCLGSRVERLRFPDPLKDPKKWKPPNNPPSFPNVVMGSYWGGSIFWIL